MRPRGPVVEIGEIKLSKSTADELSKCKSAKEAFWRFGDSGENVWRRLKELGYLKTGRRP